MIIVMLVVCYLVGALPTGYIVGKLFKNIDIRQHGSGNIGFTNVLRVMGAFPGIITLIIDIGKGYLAVFLAKIYGVIGLEGYIREIFLVGACVAAICGHNWPVYIKFKGGKGVATGCGAFLALTPVPTVCAAIMWFISVSIFNIVSVSSVFAALTLPLVMILQRTSLVYIIVGGLMSFITIYRHRENIARLKRGEEPQFIKKSKK